MRIIIQYTSKINWAGIGIFCWKAMSVIKLEHVLGNTNWDNFFDIFYSVIVFQMRSSAVCHFRALYHYIELLLE